MSIMLNYIFDLDDEDTTIMIDELVDNWYSPFCSLTKAYVE
ncbi:MAG: hypothetical protein ACQEQI_04600 [Bacillota bacterium]